jgi:YidC/Oxa1 family membrane protein insertase
LNPWELIIQQPVINVLIVMTHYLADNFGLAIVALTLIVNLAMLPLTLSQIRSAKAMQDLQPKMAEIQKKYGKDRQKLAQEQMRLYKESGVKPAGCALTMVVQMPVWIALYQSIMLALAVAPEGLLNLSRYLYHWPVLFTNLPLNNEFLAMDLAQPFFVLAILVGATMWLQQKMSTTPALDPKQAQQAQLMLWMMPMMFAVLALSFPAGLSLYWVTSSVFRIILQYRVSGWGGLRFGRQAAPAGGEAPKKYIKFQPATEKNEEVAADVVLEDKGPSKATLPKPTKNRYLPGRDRAPRRKKK